MYNICFWIQRYLHTNTTRTNSAFEMKFNSCSSNRNHHQFLLYFSVLSSLVTPWIWISSLNHRVSSWHPRISFSRRNPVFSVSLVTHHLHLHLRWNWSRHYYHIQVHRLPLHHLGNLRPLLHHHFPPTNQRTKCCFFFDGKSLTSSSSRPWPSFCTCSK